MNAYTFRVGLVLLYFSSHFIDVSLTLLWFAIVGSRSYVQQPLSCTSGVATVEWQVRGRPSVGYVRAVCCRWYTQRCRSRGVHAAQVKHRFLVACACTSLPVRRRRALADCEHCACDLFTVQRVLMRLVYRVVLESCFYRYSVLQGREIRLIAVNGCIGVL